MLSRGCGHKKTKAPNDPTPAGRTFEISGSDFRVYIPSWCLGEFNGLQLIPKTHTPQNVRTHKRVINAFFAYHSTTTIPTERICNHLGIANEQQKDDALAKIISALQSPTPSEPHIDPDDHRATLFKKHLHQFFLEPGTSVLMIRDSKHSPRLVVPYKLRSRYLYQAHEGNNHSGVTRMRELLSSYWWEFKNRDIKAYVDSCDMCAKCKGNYGRHTHWPIGHCK